MQRRRMLAAVPAVALTAGCLGVITDDTLEYESQPVAVAEAVANREGYQLNGRDEFVIDEKGDLPVLGERQLIITNHIANYSVAGMDTQVSALLVVSTPKAEVAGQGLNPLGRAPKEDLVEQIGEREAEQGEVESVDETGITVLGTDTEVEKFESTTEDENGQQVDTYVYVTRVANEGDYVIAVGVLPRQLEGQESSVYAMMEGIEHPVSP